MTEKTVSPASNRFVTVIGVMSLVALLGYGVLYVYRWQVENTPPRWYLEDFEFASGVAVYVFIEPRLVFFLGDEGPFDYINSRGSSSGFSPGPGSSGRSTRDGSVIFEYAGNLSGTTIRFLDGKCEIRFNRKGTQLTLSDGREFNLKESSPLWLRINDDGTVVELDELPEGFVDFFESPPPDPGFLDSVKSYPEAFRK